MSAYPLLKVITPILSFQFTYTRCRTLEEQPAVASIAPAYTSSPQGIGSPQLVWYAVWYGMVSS